MPGKNKPTRVKSEHKITRPRPRMKRERQKTSTKKFTQLTLGTTETLKTGKDTAQKIKIKARENIESSKLIPSHYRAKRKKDVG